MAVRGTTQPEGGFASSLAGKDRLRPALLSDQVYDLLRAALIDGDLQPGERVVESEIARRLGVSQAPVREAVKRLAREGVLEHIPRRGNFVAEVSERDVEHARQVREPLERLAGELAATAITAAELSRLDDLVREMHDAVARGDLGRFRDADITFHATVGEAAGNPFLARMWGVLEPSLRTLRAIADPLFDGDWQAMADEHGRLVALLREGDPQAAGQAFAEHAAGRGPVPDRRSTRAKRPPPTP